MMRSSHFFLETDVFLLGTAIINYLNFIASLTILLRGNSKQKL